ncbi:TPA: SDR family oxidoreductase [Stenotrophomonas maltophilia]|uniref:SDR family oxidoreductase n=1 Tax=Stenotrophomonas sp. TaxID=69392 RepID=UPI0028B0AF8C|nr:SDR family oxidoreductase [Stenotrophomonas sp.]HDS0948076.1 SDR family oxidoreductase [Stenotrophomonas maltophilia]HDS1025842.1 SDR family oxidoreductase [Stenotrophomonas maltophilia]HDS1029987.1 SDR family oxidoreductase [Stenotrophomonas maltophilia]HDS1033226.1 SDR family oxidoreductase [Stenotrophomonas maltophilia]
MRLHDRIALITGASAGIGRACALRFAAEGARLVLNARRLQPLQELAEHIRAGGGEVVVHAGDVAQADTAQALVDVACQAYGGLDIAINNAGMLGPSRPTAELAPADWRQVMATNLDAGFHAARAQLPALQARGGGSLVFIGTFVGHTVGFPGMAAYAASKAGLIGLSQVIAAEYGAQRIRSNVLLPGGTDTEMGRQAAATEEARDFVRSLHALKRMAEPEEIANAALFLAGDESSFITGSALRVEGGVSITRT